MLWLMGAIDDNLTSLLCQRPQSVSHMLMRAAWHSDDMQTARPWSPWSPDGDSSARCLGDCERQPEVNTIHPKSNVK